MKLLCLLGTGDYKEATYHSTSCGEYRTNLFPEALVNWFHPDEVIVLLTQEVMEHPNWHNLRERIGEETSIKPVTIPSGKTEEELWEIFDKLAEALTDGDEVMFDITHGFRSLQVLTLSAAAYLRIAKGIRVKQILYGAYEARNEGRAPVFDLTLFVRLLDWAAATDRFIKSGDARELANLLEDAHQFLWRSQARNEGNELPTDLKKVANTLKRLSRALLLTRPTSIAERAKELEGQLGHASKEFERFAKPFAVLLNKVSDAYLQFTTNDLETQRELVRWYMDHDHWIQGATLAREWLISYASRQIPACSGANREQVERAFGQLYQEASNRTVTDKTDVAVAIEGAPVGTQLINAWVKISDLRNDLAHCGERDCPRTPDSIVNQCRQIRSMLSELPLDHGGEDPASGKPEA